MIECILQKILATLARAIIAKHKPFVVGVAGSYGKTSARDAVAHVLGHYYEVRVSRENYNNEYGLSLSIIGAQAPGRSLRKWFSVFFIGVREFFGGNYPHILVLEYGVDHPGDMKVLTSIVRPHIAIVTAVSAAHKEYFDSLADIAKEEGGLVEALTTYEGSDEVLRDVPSAAVLGIDSSHVKNMAGKTSKSTYTYSIGGLADFSATHEQFSANDGITFKLGMIERSVPVRLPYIVGTHSISSALVAISVATVFKLGLVDVLRHLESFTLPVSRMRLLRGAADFHIIDDTYNASQETMVAAIDTLAHVGATRSIAVLGDMLELGDQENTAHETVAQSLVAHKIPLVILVGRRMAGLGDILQESGYFLGETLFLLDSPQDASDVLQRILQSGDVVLVKGSQGMRMESVVTSVLSSEYDVQRFVCRQSDAWLEKPFVQP